MFLIKYFANRLINQFIQETKIRYTFKIKKSNVELDAQSSLLSSVGTLKMKIPDNVTSKSHCQLIF